METRVQRLFLGAPLKSTIGSLALSLVCGSSLSFAQEEAGNNPGLDRVITPDTERREIRQARVDTEDFEIGVFAGALNVEDFGTNAVGGLRLAYHVSEDFFMEANYALSTTRETSFEKLSGSTVILTDDQRDLSYYNLSVGYNLFPGEIFISDKYAFNSNFYLIAGVGNTNFADDEHFTYNLGVGFRFYATDWIAVHIDMRDHVFEHDLLGEDQVVNNLEAHAGITFFF